VVLVSPLAHATRAKGAEPGGAGGAAPTGGSSASLAQLLAGSRAAPAFKTRTLDGHPLDLATLTHRGPVLLDFWATWCEPCIASLPELEAIQRRHQARGLTIVGISADGPRNFSKVRPFVARYDLTFPIVLDEDGSLVERYQVRAMPTTILIDGSGRIVTVRTGYRPGANDEIEAAIRTLLTAAAPDTADTTRTTTP
jgi:cytochrome c biogenesis protein CcmG, thiol:disulfide interchange protein DsbE